MKHYVWTVMLIFFSIVSSLQLQIAINTLPYISSGMMSHFLPEMLKKDINLLSLVRIMKTSDYGLADAIADVCKVLSKKTLLGMRDFAAGSRRVQSMLLSNDCIINSRAISKEEINKLFANTIAALPGKVTAENFDSFLEQIQKIDEIDPYLSYRFQQRWLQNLNNLIKLINQNPQSAINVLLYKSILPIRLNGPYITDFSQLAKHIIDQGIKSNDIGIKATSILSFLVARYDKSDKFNDFMEIFREPLAKLEESFAKSYNRKYLEFKLESSLPFSTFCFADFFDANSIPEVIALAGWFAVHSSSKSFHSHFKHVIESVYMKLSDRDYLVIIDAVIIPDPRMNNLIKELLGISRDRLPLTKIPQHSQYLLSCLDAEQRISYFRQWERRLPEKSNCAASSFNFELEWYLVPSYWTIPATIESLPSNEYLISKALEHEFDLYQIQKGHLSNLPWNNEHFCWSLVQFISNHVLTRLHFSASLTLPTELADWFCCSLTDFLEYDNEFLKCLSSAICTAYGIVYCDHYHAWLG